MGGAAIGQQYAIEFAHHLTPEGQRAGVCSGGGTHSGRGRSGGDLV